MPGTTPVYGFPYPEPTDLVADYPALGQQLAEDIEDVLPTIGGLAPATPTTIANSGGTASLSGNTVTFSGVSSVSLNGCFTSTFTNYRIVIAKLTVTTADQDVLFRLRSSGSDAASNYSWGAARLTDTALAWIAGNNNTTFSLIGRMTTSYNNNAVVLDVLCPNVAIYTQMQYASNLSIAQYYGFATHMGSAAYDGFTLSPGGNAMAGEISVYGYNE